MTKLTDLQTILLSGASQRSSGQLLAAATSVTAAPERIVKAIATLLKNSLVDEVTATATDHTWRVADDQRFGAVIDDAGRRAIGIELEHDEAAQDEQTLMVPVVPSRGPTKAALVLSLLQREQGVTNAELIDATGWLPHTVRAALTGVRKKGHAVAKAKRGEETCYTVGL